MPLFVIEAQTDNSEESDATGRRETRLSFLQRIRVMHLCELWAFSHLLVAICMGATLCVETVIYSREAAVC